MTGLFLVLQTEEQVPEVDSCDPLSHELSGACSTWASRMGRAWPSALWANTREPLSLLWTFLFNHSKHFYANTVILSKRFQTPSPLQSHPWLESQPSVFFSGQLLPELLGWLLSVWSEPPFAAPSGKHTCSHTHYSHSQKKATVQGLILASNYLFGLLLKSELLGVFLSWPRLQVMQRTF